MARKKGKSLSMKKGGAGKKIGGKATTLFTNRVIGKY